MNPKISAVISLILLLSSHGTSLLGQAENGPIAFISDRDGNYDLYLTDPEGLLIQVIPGAASSGVEQHPAWSPDGKYLAFSSDRDGDFEIYVLDLCAGTTAQLTYNSAADYYPSWSPDGSQIVFESYRDGNPEIYKMNSDGQAQMNLTRNSAIDGNPDWSPDGTRIVFHSWRGGTADVYVMDATDGSGPDNLTSGLWTDFARWSPDGSKISFSHSGSIWVMNADGSDRYAILSVPGVISPYGSDWSPDGKDIVIFSDRFDSNWEVYVMNAGGGSLRNISNHPATDQAAAWAPLLAECMPPSPVPFLRVPISGRAKIEGKFISAIMDHSQPGVYNCHSSDTCDNVVLAFNGEKGEKRYGLNCSPSGYRQDCAGAPFFVAEEITYVGSCGGSAGSECPQGPDEQGNHFLNYDGHSGTDFAYEEGRQVLAAAGGTLEVPLLDEVNCSGVDPHQQFNTLRILHANGLETWYLHLKEGSECWAFHGKLCAPDSPERPLPGASVYVHAGQRIGEVGNTGVAGCARPPVVGGFHLHFEVRRTSDQLVIDPFGCAATVGSVDPEACVGRLWVDVIFDDGFESGDCSAWDANLGCSQ